MTACTACMPFLRTILVPEYQGHVCKYRALSLDKIKLVILQNLNATGGQKGHRRFDKKIISDMALD